MEKVIILLIVGIAIALLIIKIRKAFRKNGNICDACTSVKSCGERTKERDL